MKFTCTQENLIRGLSIVSHITSKNVNLPILSNVLMEIKDGGMKLSTTDLEIGISCVVRGKIEKEGSFTANAKLITDYVNLLEGEKINLEVKDQGLEIEGKSSKTLIRGTSASEFPVIPKIDEKKTYHLNSRDFKKAVSQTIFATAFDESRPEISGVFLNFLSEDKKMILAATDTYRLAEKNIPLSKAVKDDYKVIVPTKALLEFSRVLEEEGELKISVSENQILFNQNDINITSRLIEGQYPNYQQVIPTEFKTKVFLSRQDFIKTIKKASLFSKSGINDVSLEIVPAEGKVTVSAANSQLGESVSEISGKIEGEKNQIVFNHRYLLEGLACQDDEGVNLEIISRDVAGVLRPEKSKDFLYIIMPIKQ